MVTISVEATHTHSVCVGGSESLSRGSIHGFTSEHLRARVYSFPPSTTTPREEVFALSGKRRRTGIGADLVAPISAFAYAKLALYTVRHLLKLQNLLME